MNRIQRFMVGICLALLANMSWADNSPADHVLKSNLAYGEMIELNQYSPGQPKGLMLRLFSTPDQDETCGLETSSTCKNKHLITVATLDELPEVQVHMLQAKGEFVKADWATPKSTSAGPDQAELILTFRQYHRFATRANPKLARKFFRIGLKITQEGVKERLL